MISGATTCFQNGSQGLQMYSVADDVLPSSLVASSTGGGTQSSALLYNLSILKDKVHQVQSLLSVVILPDHHSQAESVAVAVASMSTIIQEIIITASSMMFTCQQLSLGAAAMNNNSDELHRRHHDKAPDGGLPQATGNRVVHIGEDGGQGFLSGEHLGWYDHCVNCNNINNNTSNNRSITISNSNNNKKNKHNNNKVEEKESSHGVETKERLHDLSPLNYDIIELDAADLLAKYTHYCQVCGKGFKRDANLRMHMRAHGDEYKSAASLSNPMKNSSNSMEGYSNSMSLPRKYSCPEEGCRWNRKHAKFQPLKSMVCVKNHYKRSHCPKMYVCNRCNQKQFSVLSDLRTHEKHCGDLKWQCSCGTTFSRKDKLMGHVSLFIGHTPADNSFMKQGTVYQQHTMKIPLNDS